MATTSSRQASDWTDVLLSPEGEVERLVGLSLVDGKSEFSLGPLDQALIAVSHALIQRGTDAGILVLELPRCRHEVAITLGFALQALRLHESSGLLGSMFTFGGSAVVIGMDTAVQDRLRRVQVSGTRFPRGLAEGLGAHRIRPDGQLVSPSGALVPFEPRAKRLLYLNARAGWPTLPGERYGVAIIDRTSLRSSETVARALRWACDHAMRAIIIVGDIGDSDVALLLPDEQPNVTRVSCTPALIGHLAWAMGRGTGRSPLSTNVLLAMPQPSVTLRRADAPAEVEQLFADGFRIAVAARRVNASMPFNVARSIQMLSVMSRCVSDADTYNRNAVEDPRRPFVPLVAWRRLERDDSRLGAEWRTFEQTTWPMLRTSAMRVWERLRDRNPKLDALLNVLDELSRDGRRLRVIVRTSNRAAARATETTLRERSPTLFDALHLGVHAWSERLEPDVADVMIHAGTPPVAQLPELWSSEARQHVVLVYDAEVGLLRYLWRRVVEDSRAANSASFAMFSLGAPPYWNPELVQPIGAPEPPVIARPVVPINAGIDDVLERMRDLEAARGQADDTMSGLRGAPGATSSGGCELLPIELDSGATWWVLPDAMVDVLVGERYQQRGARVVRAGDRVIIPRGEGRESVFSRLIAAYHDGVDGAELDILLRGFRKACWRLYGDCGSNWAEVRRRLEANGANAVNQAQAWAEGDTIAPEDASDIRLIARLVGDAQLDDGWSRISATAAVLREVHRRLGRLVSRALTELVHGEGPATAELTRVLGRGAAEVLDEFVVATTVAVGAPAHMPLSMIGAVR